MLPILPFWMEFHVSRQSRDLYQFDETIFAYNGNVVFANFHAARVFAQKMNARRDLVNFPERAVRAGQINALGLVDEILHILMQNYRQQRNPQVMEQALAWLAQRVGTEPLDVALRQFMAQFPPLLVYRRQVSIDEYLQGDSVSQDGQLISNRQIALEEMLMLWLANLNPAYAPYLELFDDKDLGRNTAYRAIMDGMHDFFETQPPFGPDGQNLIDMLRAPALASPHSLSGQLEFIRNRWGGVLGKFLYRLLSSLDLIKEEEKIVFGFGGGGPSFVPDFSGAEYEHEAENFSPDREWMPRLVLMAKNSYVWLDQLSKKYHLAITRLDQIPDDELDRLARSGFTGLWLIGLWERSPASRQIKQLRGNQDAVASAYSLFSYEIAADLGGEEAYQNLRDRAWLRGIRLASDMVPNHMGIDSRWLIEHPDWFVSLDYSPFPGYTFNGPNLSWDGRVGIYLEDHYYDSTDAAVVFKRVDFWTGSEKYVYHGNDGTAMPWNDTAQLNYLIPEVREAVIQTILAVARRFPVIRFDAAMTLAKRHYQRLWFPEPGSGGDIPSRAEYGLTKAHFDQVFPEEFWRQVVDRVAQEVPDTLLLAEAFWLMEGYFVRTLGMHRVYNSAFMNMMRDEKNQEYRLVIKNTIEFDTEILKRYVNFMNNPDERTAVDQFGKGDKYFGVSTLMSTLPGLPMFGHGQLEGFTEKYGMEFRRAYWDEQVDDHLLERHEREIFPLLRRRYLFAEVSNFLLYDFYTPEGYVNEDVYAYSNQSGSERSLVLYHNRFANVRGWVRISTAFPVKMGGDERVLIQKTLGDGLGLHNDPNHYTIFRDHVTGMEYIRSNQELHQQGLYAELNAYQYHVFLDFRQVQDNEWRQYAELAAFLGGRGVPSMDEALKEIFLQPLLTPFRELINPGMLNWLIQNRRGAPDFTEVNFVKALDEVDDKMRSLLTEVLELSGGQGDPVAIAADVRRDVQVLLSLPNVETLYPLPRSRKYKAAIKFLLNGPDQRPDHLLELPDGAVAAWGPLLAWAIVMRLGQAVDELDYAEQSRTWIDEWLLGKIIAGALKEMGLSQHAVQRAGSLLRIITTHQAWCQTEEKGKPAERAYRMLQSWLKDSEVQAFMRVNRYQDVLWYNKESFEELLWWLYAAGAVCVLSHVMQSDADVSATAQELIANYELVDKLLRAENASEYQVEKLLEAARE